MKYLPLLLLFFICIACRNNPQTKSSSADNTAGEGFTGYEVKQLSGVFYDTLPCNDCPGIATSLYLKPDKTFIIERQYIGKSTFYETGTWSVTDSLLQLNGTDSATSFKIENYTQLEMLDGDQKQIENGDKKPALFRNNVPFKPLQPVPVEGVYSALQDTMKIHICSMKKDFAATLAPTAMMMTSSYKKVAKSGEPVYVKLAGHFELRPSLNDTITQDFFVIEKFIKFEPEKSCK